MTFQGSQKKTALFWDILRYNNATFMLHARTMEKSCPIAYFVLENNNTICFNPLNPELNPTCYLLALLGAHHSLHVRRIRVKLLTFRRLMSDIYGAPILDVSRSHTTTQHSR